MLRLYRNELICDFAETYHVYDIRSLPARLAAIFAVGLRADSRTMTKLSGAKVPPDLFMLAAAVDRLSLLVWAQTDDARKGRNKPEMITEKILGTDDQKKVARFTTAEDFESEWKRRTGGKRNG